MILEVFENCFNVYLMIVSPHSIGFEDPFGDGSIEMHTGLLIAWNIQSLDHFEDVFGWQAAFCNERKKVHQAIRAKKRAKLSIEDNAAVTLTLCLLIELATTPSGACRPRVYQSQIPALSTLWALKFNPFNPPIIHIMDRLTTSITGPRG